VNDTIALVPVVVAIDPAVRIGIAVNDTAPCRTGVATISNVEFPVSAATPTLISTAAAESALIPVSNDVADRVSVALSRRIDATTRLTTPGLVANVVVASVVVAVKFTVPSRVVIIVVLNEEVAIIDDVAICVAIALNISVDSEVNDTATGSKFIELTFMSDTALSIATLVRPGVPTAESDDVVERVIAMIV